MSGHAPDAGGNAGLTPRQLCRSLLAALEASEGRRRARKRDQTPDALGLNARRALLERVVRDDPEPEQFEAWLMQYAQRSAPGEGFGAVWAMAQALFEDWRLAHVMPHFAQWLAQGAPSEDAAAEPSGSTPRSPAA